MLLTCDKHRATRSHIGTLTQREQGLGLLGWKKEPGQDKKVPKGRQTVRSSKNPQPQKPAWRCGFHWVVSQLPGWPGRAPEGRAGAGRSQAVREGGKPGASGSLCAGSAKPSSRAVAHLSGERSAAGQAQGTQWWQRRAGLPSGGSGGGQ